MGPNGSGKSTLSKVVAGHEAYEVTQGDILFEGESILELDPDERAHKGVFLAFQYPVEVPGVTNKNLLRQAYNTIDRKSTRLNSSHVSISYAVFCLKKKHMSFAE